FDFDAILRGANRPLPALESIEYHAGQPYRIQYNLNVQREILPNTSLTVGFVGARGVNVFRIYNANQADPIPSTDPSRPTPFFFLAGFTDPNCNLTGNR